MKKFAWFFALAVTGVLGGCATKGELFPPVEPPIVWPSGSAPPRIAYVGQIQGKADLKVSKGFWDFLSGLGGERKQQIGDQLAGPTSVALSKEDILYVTDPQIHAVHIFDLKNRTHHLALKAAPGVPFSTPLGVALLDSRALVTDRVLHVVSVIMPDGRVEKVFGEEVLKGPVGIAVGPLTKRIYVVDTPAHNLKIFEPNGSLVGTIGGRGTEPGKFNYPTFVTCDREERIYVTDTLNFRVQVFDKNGKVLRIWGKKGRWPGQFSQPKGVCMDRLGRVFVVDSHFENVQIFSREGQLLLAFGEEGNGPGQFWLPTGVFLDHLGRIWVADTFNRRVQVFRLVGKDFSVGKTK